MKTHFIAALACVAVAGLSTTAQAADFSFAGTFAKDDSKQAFTFSLTSAASVTFTSFGYAGGMNAAGKTIAAGGFDSVLSLYDAMGQIITTFDDGVTPDPVTGEAWDPVGAIALGAGRYTVFLSQYDNFGPANLTLPFAFEGQSNFRDGFVDFRGSKRTGNYALDIGNVSVATAVPESSTWVLMMIGFGAAGAGLRRRRVKVSYGRSLV